MKLLITGTGTGGHIYPAIAVAKKMRNAIPDANVLYVGSRYGNEKRLVAQEKIPFHGMNIRDYKAKSLYRRILMWLMHAKCTLDAVILLRRYRPDLVLGTGGTLSNIVVFMAWVLGFETMIHEQNAVPARATQFLGRYTSKILVSYKESIPYFKNQNRLYYTGNPVREVFHETTREAARAALQIPPTDFVVLFYGGTDGAEVINNMALALIESHSADDKLHIFLLTGKSNYKRVKRELEGNNLSHRIHIHDYSHNIVRMMLASDLAVCRAGAVGLAEMTAIALPGILVPNKKSANNHQVYNADVFEKAGACLVVEEGPQSVEQFLEMFERLQGSPSALSEMKANFAQLARENALNTIISIIYTYHLR